MTTYIKGTPEFKARLKAIRTNVIKPVGAKWQDEAVRYARGHLPNRNTRYSKGLLHDSVRPGETKKGRRSKSGIEPTVIMRYTGNFINSGTKGGGLKSRAKSRSKSRTIFSPRARKGYPPGGRLGSQAAHFKVKSAHHALEKVPMAKILVDAWNAAA